MSHRHIQLKTCINILVLALVCALSACNPNRSQTSSNALIVFAAASLTEPFTQISRQFELKNPGVDMTLVFAGSQQLATQIREGAAVDVFASANSLQLDQVVEAGLIDGKEVQFFSSNRLVVIVPRDNPAGIDDLQNLTQPGRRLVLAAAEVPVGMYTLEFLDLADRGGELSGNFKDQVLQNVVSYENDVKAVVTKVVLGEADAGIVYSSDVTPEVADQLIRVEIPDRWNVLAQYPIAPLMQSKHPNLARAFVDHILSPQGQAVLRSSGFLQVSDEPILP